MTPTPSVIAERSDPKSTYIESPSGHVGKLLGNQRLVAGMTVSVRMERSNEVIHVQVVNKPPDDTLKKT